MKAVDAWMTDVCSDIAGSPVVTTCMPPVDKSTQRCLNNKTAPSALPLVDISIPDGTQLPLPILKGLSVSAGSKHDLCPVEENTQEEDSEEESVHAKSGVE